MLNIYKEKKKINDINIKNINHLEKTGKFVPSTKHFIPANKEWFNSVYTFNKNSIKLLPIADNFVIKLIRGYFNMWSPFLQRKNKARRMRNWRRRLWSRKFWISRPELKHTNDKVIIDLYIYNRQKQFFTSKIKNLLLYNISKHIKNNKIQSNRFLKNLRNKSDKFLSLINIKNKYLGNYEKLFIKKIIKLKKEIFIMHFIQSIFFNRFKFTSLFIEPLKIILSKIYKKKVVLNLIKLKSFFLNIDILSQIVTTKTRKRKNRILNVLGITLANIRTPVFQKRFILRESPKYISVQNTLVKKTSDFIKDIDLKKKDSLNEIINYKFKTNTRPVILNSIKNKTVSGVRFEASGRLTKRIVAAKAISKISYVGTLKNIDSSYKGLSSVILRGNTNSNTQLTKLKSKTRIGSFGIKGWISTM